MPQETPSSKKLCDITFTEWIMHYWHQRLAINGDADYIRGHERTMEDRVIAAETWGDNRRILGRISSESDAAG